MRVGVIGPLDSDSFAVNILDCLPDLGVTAIPLGPAGPMSSRKAVTYTAAAITRLGAEAEWLTHRPVVKRVRDAECDVVINVQQSLMPEVVKAIKSSRTKVCLWYPDHVANIGRMSMVVADYDALFIKDPLFADRLSGVYGLPTRYVPEACNPRWHKPLGDPFADPHIAVVGNIYPTRARLLLRLHRDGIPLRLYGSGFPRWLDSGPLEGLHAGRSVFQLDKARVFRQARGVLNNLHPAEMDSVNCRLFEATASGGAVLCERRQALGDLFSEGTEVLAFASYAELLEHCESLLEDPDTGKTLGDRASSRALSEHTYQIRLREMLAFFV